MQTSFRTNPKIVPAGTADRFTFHQSLKWNGRRRIVHRLRFGEGGIRGQWTRMITADRRASQNELGGGRRAGIVAFEFSKLPLARQEPKRIVNASLQRVLHFGTV